MPMHAPHVHVMGSGPMATGHHTSLDVLCLHAVAKAVSTGAAARLLWKDGGEKEGKGNRRKDEGIRKKKDWGDKTQRQEKKKKVEPKKKKKRKQVKCITQLSDSNNKCSHFSWNIALKQSTPYSSKQQIPFPHNLPTSGSPEDDLFPTYLTYI